MLKKFFNDRSALFDPLIDDVINKMNELGPEDDQYPALVKYLAKLEKMKAQSRRPRLNKEVLLTVLGNLAGILVIVAYEQRHVLTSKGLQERIRPKGRYSD